VLIVDAIEQIIRALVMVGLLIAVVLVMAALFMIVFNLATGIDDQIQE
jgi:cell division protein FtsX